MSWGRLRLVPLGQGPLGPAAGLVHFPAAAVRYMVTASIPGAPCAATLLLMPLARLHLLSTLGTTVLDKASDRGEFGASR